MEGTAPQLDATSRSLLDAFISISSDLDTGSVLHRIVVSACDLTAARYGALGVLGHDGRLADFITHGMDRRTVHEIGDPPVGRGLLDVSAFDDATLRLDDLSTHEKSAGFPPHHPPMRTLLRVPIKVRGTVFGQLYLTEKAGGRPFDDEDTLLVQSLASVAGFVVENARAYGLSERRRRWLEMFGELNELLTPPITLTAALGRIADSVRAASGARASFVVQVPEVGDPFAAAMSGSPFDYSEVERHLYIKAIRNVVETGDVVELPFRDLGIVLMAPLRAHLTMPGVLIITHDRQSHPDLLEERELLASFAHQAALALDRTQALEDREQMAVISDRDRIARDLHDVVIQRLFATGLHMQSIRTAAPTAELRDRIDSVAKDLDQTIRDIRGTIFELRNRPRNSLRIEVRDLVREYVPALGFAPTVHMDGPVDAPIDAEVQAQFVSVLREALSNVAQHAQATEATVHLQVTDAQLRLKVEDNGVGMPEERSERGLRNARRRAMLLGGDLDLWPGDPHGTMFVWCVPYVPAGATAGAE